MGRRHERIARALLGYVSNFRSRVLCLKSGTDEHVRTLEAVDLGRRRFGVGAGAGIPVPTEDLCPYCSERHCAVHSAHFRHDCTVAQRSVDAGTDPAVLGTADAWDDVLAVLLRPLDVLRGFATN